MESNTQAIEISIPSQEEKILIFLEYFIPLSIVFVIQILMNLDTLLILQISFSLVIFFSFIFWAMIKLGLVPGLDCPKSFWSDWSIPSTVYTIENTKLFCLDYTYSAEKPREINLLTVYRIIYKNSKYKKSIEIYHIFEQQKFRDRYRGPVFEKCDDDWQRLFEEIKKRVPEDTEIIIK